jgi:hypothetical protein
MGTYSGPDELSLQHYFLFLQNLFYNLPLCARVLLVIYSLQVS